MSPLFKLILTLFLLMYFLSNAYGEREFLTEADSLFASGQYVQSKTLYEQLYSEGTYTPAMLLRLAYIEEGLKNFPQALLYLSVYVKRYPDAEVLAKMAKMAQQHGYLGYEYNENAYLLNLFNRYRTGLLLALEGLVLLTFLMMAYATFSGRQIGAARVILLLVLSAGLGVLANRPANDRTGILTGPRDYLMAGPSAGAEVEAVVSAGHRVEITGKEGPWLKIAWADRELFVRDILVAPVR